MKKLEKKRGRKNRKGKSDDVEVPILQVVVESLMSVTDSHSLTLIRNKSRKDYYEPMLFIE